MNAPLQPELTQPALFKPDHPRLRHQLLFADAPEAAGYTGASSIKTVEQLRRHLQTAIEVEHSTIPPYLCALYSIDDSINDATSTFAYRTIQGVVMEEMLHMLLACNILNAIGGHPAINTRHFVPSYPTYLPHSSDAFLVPLQKFSKAAVGVFLQIEQPAARTAPPQANHWDTLGQFYHAIAQALRRLDRETPGGIFTGDRSHQLGSHHFYGGGGKLIEVHGLADALLAINEIVGQGEGMNGSIVDPDHRLFGEEIEYAHYYRYNELMMERRYLPRDKPQDPPSGPPVVVDWNAVYNMRENPRMADYPPGSELWQKTREFNQTYMALLGSIHHACNGKPETLGQAIPLMYDLKYKAQALMQMPVGGGQTAGPSFEFVD